MMASSGYTLDQLLDWCRQDELIENFERQEEIVVITHGGRRLALQPEEALTLLKDLFASRSGGSTTRIPGLEGLRWRKDRGATS